MRKVVLTYGLIAGGILSAAMWLTMPFQKQIGFEYGMVVGYTTMVVAFLMVYFGVRSYRDHMSGGRISFGRGLKVGLLISLVATCCYVATWQVVYRTMSTDFMEEYASYQMEQAREEGKSEAEIATMKADMDRFAEMYKNPLVNIAFTFLEPLPVALLFSFLSAWLLSRPQREVVAVT